MPPDAKMPPKIFNNASQHEAVVKYRQPNEQTIENIIQMCVSIVTKTKNLIVEILNL